MGMIELSEATERVIEQEVAAGRAASRTAFLETAVQRFVDEAALEAADIESAVKAGLADMDAGRYVSIDSAADEQRLRDGMILRLQSRLAAKS